MIFLVFIITNLVFLLFNAALLLLFFYTIYVFSISYFMSKNFFYGLKEEFFEVNLQSIEDTKEQINC